MLNKQDLNSFIEGVTDGELRAYLKTQYLKTSPGEDALKTEFKTLRDSTCFNHKRPVKKSINSIGGIPENKYRIGI